MTLNNKKEILRFLKKIVKKRRNIHRFLNKFNFKRVCEVGVREGHNLKRLARATPEVLVGIDIWDLDKNRKGYFKKSSYWEKNLRKWASKQKFTVKLIKDYSLNAVHLFEDDYFDFVYIDGDHTYKSASQDIKEWWQKVRKGGILAGHDYSYLKKKKDLKAKKNKLEVKRAVQEFISKNNLNRGNLYVTKEDLTTTFLILKL